MDQDATPLGKDVGLGLCDVVLDGDSAPPEGDTALSFRPLFIMATVAHLSYC